MPLTWRGVDQNPLWNVESLHRTPVSIAFAIHPDLTVVVDTCFELHLDTASRVATDCIREGHVEPILEEGETADSRSVSSWHSSYWIHRTRLRKPDYFFPEPPAPRSAHQVRSPWRMSNSRLPLIGRKTPVLGTVRVLRTRRSEGETVEKARNLVFRSAGTLTPIDQGDSE